MCAALTYANVIAVLAGAVAGTVTMLRYRPNTDEPVRSRPSKAIMALCTVAGTLTGGSAFWRRPRVRSQSVY